MDKGVALPQWPGEEADAAALAEGLDGNDGIGLCKVDLRRPAAGLDQVEEEGVEGAFDLQGDDPSFQAAPFEAHVEALTLPLKTEPLQS